MTKGAGFSPDIGRFNMKMSSALKAKYGNSAPIQAPAPLPVGDVQSDALPVKKTVSLIKDINLKDKFEHQYSAEDLRLDIVEGLDAHKFVHIDASDLEVIPQLDFFDEAIAEIISSNKYRLDQLKGRLKFRFSERQQDRLPLIIELLQAAEQDRIKKQRSAEIGQHLKETSRGTKPVLSED